MTRDDKNVLHVIDQQGNKCVIPFVENVDAKYRFDIDWYLANGYKRAEDVFMEIEQTGEVFKQTLNGDFEDFELLSDKTKKQIMRYWPQDVWDKYRDI
ncbi:MAG: hypothetical protein NC453_12290 [Muribaculum sp.]|nr:hypothetical protein [Muribaculum sp.]